MYPPLVSLLPAEVWIYSLVFARVGAMVATMPVFGEIMAPQRVRLIIALALTLVLAPVSGIAAGAAPPPMALAAMATQEVIVGLMIGLAARFITAAVQIAGHVIAMQLGLSFAMTADPSQGGGQGAILGTFMSLMAITLILATDLHHLLIGAMRHSYVLFPPGAPVSAGEAAQWALSLFSAAFALGIQMASPFLAFGIVFQVTAGIISRMMPQVQIFFLTVPVSILGGYVFFMFTLSAMMMLFLNSFSETMAPMAGM